MPDEVNQKGNVVGGDQAGGHITKSTQIFYGSDTSNQTPIGKLIEKFKKEREGDVQFDEIVEKLQHFSLVAEDEEVIGLEAKMVAGRREHLLNFANHTKELFTKKLIEFQFSESAQRIHAHLLAEVWTRFSRHVYPSIQAKASQAEIESLIQSQIVNPVRNLLEDNVTELYADEINGILYFLTGNCRIKWV